MGDNQNILRIGYGFHHLQGFPHLYDLLLWIIIIRITAIFPYFHYIIWYYYR